MIDSFSDIENINDNSIYNTSDTETKISKEKVIEFIWHDSNVENINIHLLKELLKSMALDYKVTKFNTLHEATEYILQQKHNTDFYALTCGRNGKDFTNKIYLLPNVRSIYVFCMNVKDHERWAIAYAPKLARVESNINQLLKLIMNELKGSSLRIAEKLTSLGDEYKLKGEYHEALKHLTKSWETYKVLNSNTDSESAKIDSIRQKIQSIAESSYQIGHIHKRNGEYDGAISKFQECLTVYQNTLRNHSEDFYIGMCYQNLADCYLLEKNQETAFAKYFEALEIFKTLDAKQEICHIIDRLEIFALEFKKNHEYNKANNFFRKVLSAYHKLTKQFSDQKIIRLYMHIGDCYKMLGNHDKSLQNYQEALNIIPKLEFEAVNLDIQNSLELIDEYHNKEEITDEQMINYASTIQSIIESIRLYQHQFDQDHSKLGPITKLLKNTHCHFCKCHFHGVESYSKLVNIYKKLKEDEYTTLKKIDYLGLLVTNITGISTKVGNCKKVIDALEKALKACDENDPKIANFYLQIGELCKNENQFSQALQNYSNALRIFEKDAKNNSPEIYKICKILIQINLELALSEKFKGNIVQATKSFDDAISNCKECLQLQETNLKDPSKRIFQGFSYNDYSSEIEDLYKRFALIYKDSISLIKNSPQSTHYEKTIYDFTEFLIDNKHQFTNKLAIASFYIDICKWYDLSLNNDDLSRQACLQIGLEIIHNHQDNVASDAIAKNMLRNISNFIGF